MSIRDMALMAMGMLAFAPVTMAVEPEEIPLERLSCTSIMVGKKASADGSVMTSHTCDGRYRTWMNWVPASDNKPGATTDICKGLMRTETAESKDRVEVLGKILRWSIPTDFSIQPTLASTRRDWLWAKQP